MDTPLDRRLLWGILALALVANAPVLGVAYVLDDHHMVERDERVQSLQWGRIWTQSYWNSDDKPVEYRPFVVTTYAVERSLFGPSPFHFHFVNWLLHALLCVAVLLGGRAIGLGDRAAAIGAALFAIHPVHLDAIAPIVGRAELLAAFGFVVPVVLWVKLRRAPEIQPGRLAAFAAALAVGALSKENALAVVPLVLTVETLIFRFAAPRKTLVAGVATGAVVVVAVLALRVGVLGELVPAAGSGSIVALENPLVVEPAAVRWLTAASLLGTYARLFAWPVGLSPDYSAWSLSVVRELSASVWIPVVLAVALGGLALLFLRRRPSLAIATLAFFAPYAIVSNAPFVIGTMLAERLLYLPSVGLVWGVGLAIDEGFRALGPRLESPRRWLPLLAAPALVLVAMNLARANVWRDEGRLYREAAEVYPRNFLLRRNLGSLALEAQRFPEALYHFEQLTELAPEYAKGWGDRGFLVLARGEAAAAVPMLERSVELEPRDATVWQNLAAGYEALGRYRDAERARLEAAVLLEKAEAR